MLQKALVGCLDLPTQAFSMRTSNMLLFVSFCFLLSACGGGGAGSSEKNETDQGAVTDSDSPSTNPDASDPETESPTEEFVVRVRSSGEGVISPTSALIVEGETASFELAPEAFHEVSSVDGCNGHLNGTTYTTDSLLSDCEITVEFDHVAIADTWIIDDPVSAYNSQCDSPAIFFTIPTDLNQDSHKDLLIHYWCGSQNFGSVDTTPTEDALAALINDGEGNFTLQNTEIFGASLAQLGGAARKYSSGDLNGDGVEDFSFAMNWEDGRSSNDVTDIATEPAVILSQTDGTYVVERLGVPDWGHATEIINNPDGTRDALFAGFVGGVGPQSFTWLEGIWADSSDNYPSTSYAVTLGSSEDSSGTTEHLFGSGGGSVPNIDMLSRINGSWELTSRHEINRLFQVDWYAWNDTLGPVDVVEVNGERYFMGAYFQTCTASNLFENNDRYLIAQVSSASTDEEIVEGQVYDQDDTRNVSILQFFKIDGNQLILVESPIVDEEIDINANFFDCSDINGDGMADVVMYAYTQPWANSRENAGGKPIVYVNDGSGSLIRKSLEAIPGHSTAGENGMGPSLQSIVHDMNNDGIKDIILMGYSTGGPDSEEGDFEIHIIREQFWSE